MVRDFSQEVEEFKAYWKSKKKADLIGQMAEFLSVMMQQDQEIRNLKESLARQSARYLANCHSAGGITLPPGV